VALAELTLLGTFELRLSNGAAADLPGQKDRALLAILALSGGAPQSRDKLAGLLWSDHGEPRARDSLKHALARVRQSLGESLANALAADRQSVQLETTGLSIDVVTFERLARDATPVALEQACALCAGDLLEGIGIRDAAFEEWLENERHRLRRLHEEALTKLLVPALPAATRERAARCLLALDPLREAASRALMQLHAERGESAQAVKLFESLRERLHAELGVKPEPETVRLHEAIRQGRAAPAAGPGESGASAGPAGEHAAPDKPSIAVLAFQNLSGDPEQEYFADGMVEEIITALSRMPWLFVIARNSSFTYRHRAVDVKQIGRELGVRYILEGSVRKAANRVRISGQLIDAATGAHLWAERFDGKLEDVFDLQDQVAASVVGAIAPKLEQAEIERAERKPTDSLDAYDHFLRGMACVHQWTRQANNEALRHFQRSVELDPEYASAYGMAARCYSQRKASGWVADREQEIAETARLARHAVQFGKDDPVAICTAGIALVYVVGDLENGDALIEQALALNPNWAWAWLYSGWSKNWLGEPEVALERIHRAMRMSPQDPQFFNMQASAAWSHLLAGRNAEAQSWARAALRGHPDYLMALRVLAASTALLGDTSEARSVMARLRELDPDARISTILQHDPLHRQEHLAAFAQGLRLAGMPE
jgi:TolB-like protein/DNA-binding SARP family transcriptional activator